MTSEASGPVILTLLTIVNFKPMNTGALRGFCDVALENSMVLLQCSVFMKDGRAWASPPSKQVVGRNGTVLRTADGKTRYEPTVSFVDRATQERWSASVIDALRRTHPEVLS